MQDTACPVCGNLHMQLMRLASDRELKVCLACGLHRRWPPPEAVPLQKHYEQDYFKDRDESEATQRLGVFRHYLSRLEKNLSGRRLLDVGCGLGHFLLIAQERGWDAIGVELYVGATAAGEARGVRIVEGGDAALEALPANHDLITMWNVLIR